MTITGALAICLVCASIIQVGGMFLTELICKALVKWESKPQDPNKKTLKEIAKFRLNLLLFVIRYKIKEVRHG